MKKKIGLKMLLVALLVIAVSYFPLNNWAEKRSNSLKLELTSELSSFVDDHKIDGYSIYKKKKNPFIYEYGISIWNEKDSIEPSQRLQVSKNYLFSMKNETVKMKDGNLILD